MSATPRPHLYQNLDYLGDAGKYVDDVCEVISRGPLFEQLTHQEIEALCQFMHCFAAHRDTVLLNEGDQGDYLLIILSGAVAVNKQGPKGEKISIATVHPGATLGEMSLFDGEPRFASCVTTEPTDIAVMTRADLNEVLLTHPRLGNKFMIRLVQIVIGRLRDMGRRIVTNYLDPVED